jgi:hypothetical protein
MSKTLRGSCLCGGVTYALNGPLRPMIVCHCIQCRKMSGHFIAATQSLASDVEGESLKWYRSSDVAERGFCAGLFNAVQISLYARMCSRVRAPFHRA